MMPVTKPVQRGVVQGSRMTDGNANMSMLVAMLLFAMFAVRDANRGFYLSSTLHGYYEIRAELPFSSNDDRTVHPHGLRLAGASTPS